MKKFPILQVFLVVLFVGVLAFGFFMSKKKSTTQEVVKIQTESTASGSEKSIDSLYEAEQKKLQEKMEAYNAYNSAVDALDISLCEKIVGNDKIKAECIDNVYSGQASKEKNVALCEKIQDTVTKARCTSSFAYDSAVATGKEADCEKIVGDNDLKIACKKNIVFAQIENQSFSGTTDVCATLSGDDKDYCINRIKKDGDVDLLQKGTTTKDINACLQIQDATMKTTCSDTVYMTLALEKKDGTLCGKIVDVGRKTNCTTQFARITDASLLQEAIGANNLSMCAKITTLDFRTKCTDNILLKQGVANKDTATCAKIIDPSTKKQCSDAVKIILEQTNK